jgi:hypothetical protein
MLNKERRGERMTYRRAAGCEGNSFFAVLHVPGSCLLSLLMLLFDPLVLNDTRPQNGYWAMMWIVAKLGFFVWVLRQLLRYTVFNWTQKFRKGFNSYPQSTQPISSRNHKVRPPFTNVEIISRRTIPRPERRPMWR